MRLSPLLHYTLQSAIVKCLLLDFLVELLAYPTPTGVSGETFHHGMNANDHFIKAHLSNNHPLGYDTI